MLLKIRAAVQPEGSLEKPGIGGVSQGLIQFLAGPNVESSFHSTGLGIEGGIESSFGTRQFPFDESQRFLHDSPVNRFGSQTVGLRINFGELCVFAKHFFEMRHGPRMFGAVAMEAAPQLIVNAAP